MTDARELHGRAVRAVAMIGVGALASLVSIGPLAQSTLPVDSIKLPDGFSIEVVARVPNARAMTVAHAARW